MFITTRFGGQRCAVLGTNDIMPFVSKDALDMGALKVHLLTNFKEKGVITIASDSGKELYWYTLDKYVPPVFHSLTEIIAALRLDNAASIERRSQGKGKWTVLGKTLRKKNCSESFSTYLLSIGDTIDGAMQYFAKHPEKLIELARAIENFEDAFFAYLFFPERKAEILVLKKALSLARTAVQESSVRNLLPHAKYSLNADEMIRVNNTR